MYLVQLWFLTIFPRKHCAQVKNSLYFYFNVKNNEQSIFTISKRVFCQPVRSLRPTFVLSSLFCVYDINFFQPISGEPVKIEKIIFIPSNMSHTWKRFRLRASLLWILPISVSRWTLCALPRFKYTGTFPDSPAKYKRPISSAVHCQRFWIHWE